MKKKLDTRFPAARIKKIMQTDEEIGKIAMAVPLLVSKALELFLQDLCDRTYGITLKKGAKTVNSLHLKQCIQSFNMFDFLKDTVSRVPDLGGSDAASEDKSATKRRKNSDDEEHANNNESKRARLNETGHTSSSGRGRGRGRGRGSRTGVDRELTDQHEKYEDPPEMHYYQNGENKKEEHEAISDEVAELETTEAKGGEKVVRNFDLNVDLNENGDLDEAPTESSSTKPAHDMKHEDIISEWSLGEMEKMMIDPIQLANLNGRMDGEDEDYDEEE